MAGNSNIVRLVPPYDWYPGGSLGGTNKLQRNSRLEVEPLWLSLSKGRLEVLVSQLAVDWDGYGGKPVNFLNAYFAIQILESVCLDSTPAPSIVPGHRGDLQLEWHTETIDVELHVIAPNQVAVSLVKTFPDGTENEESFRLTNDFTAVAKWVKTISEVNIAAQPAAA